MSENGLVSYTWKITRTTMPSPIQLKNHKQRNNVAMKLSHATPQETCSSS
jgi:hypothetical protein